METALQTVSEKRPWTDSELMSLPKDGRKYELIDGRLLMSPVGSTHSRICIDLSFLLTAHARRRKLGQIFDSSIGFRLSPTILLSPDVSFVSHARLVEITVAPEKFLYGAPDLAVEVLSPSDSRKIMEGKLDKYFEHGTHLAWVVDPRHATVTVHDADSVTKLSGPATTLTGGEVLPGFKCKLSEIFLPAW